MLFKLNDKDLNKEHYMTQLKLVIQWILLKTFVLVVAGILLKTLDR
jgi:hypothetical protein